MNQNEIIEIARQAKLPHYWETGDIVCFDAVEAFAKLVTAKEREACLKLAEQYQDHWTIDAIRARGEA